MFTLTDAVNKKLSLYREAVQYKNILVTGGTGFIGSYLVDNLSNLGANVTVLTRHNVKTNSPSSYNYYFGDITKSDSLSGCCKNIDIIVHMAGSAHVEQKNKGAHLKVSLTGTKNILQEALKEGVTSVIYVSSIKVMGASRVKCLDETDQENPDDEYGRSRQEAEKIILKWGAEHLIRTSILRLPLVYGPGVKGNIKNILTHAKSGRSFPLPSVKNNRSMVYVGDVVQAIYCIIFNPKSKNQIYIVTDGQSYSTTDLTDALGDITGKVTKWHIPLLLFKFLALAGNVITYVTRIKMPFNTNVFYKLFGNACYSAEKIKNDLGYTPTETFYSVLTDMLNAE